MTANSGNLKFLPALTGVRAICVYFIFFKHFNPFHETTVAGGITHQFFSFLSFFFVLSGFLIAYRYLNTASLKKQVLKQYFINRAARVFPILILLISITFLLQMYSEGKSLSEIIKPYLLNISLLKGFSSNYYLTGIGPSWSMSVEELFYLLAPLIFLFFNTGKKLLYFVLLMYVVGICLTWLFHVLPFDGFFSTNHFTFSVTFFGRAFEFACGIFMAYIMHGKTQSGLLSRIPLPTYSGLMIVAVVIVVQYFIARYFHVQNGLDVWQGMLCNNILLPLGILIFYYGLVYESSLLKRFLSSDMMVRLGNSTYSFYLLHTSFVAGWIAKYISNHVLIIFVVMVVVAILFHACVEQPLAKYVRKIQR
jgi:peptidoglycan/LPS O-acetylase OafA/YrhL